MILKKLEIELKQYGKHAGQHVGKVEFMDEVGNVSINLTPELCDKIFLICADGIINTAKEAANNLTCNVIEHQKALEAPANKSEAE